MVLSIETTLAPRRGLVKLEDTVAVTATGGRDPATEAAAGTVAEYALDAGLTRQPEPV